MKASLSERVSSGMILKKLPRRLGEIEITEIGNYVLEENGFFSNRKESLLLNDRERKVIDIFKEDGEVDIKADVSYSSKGNTVSQDEFRYVSDLIDDEGMDGRITFDSGELRNVTVFDTEEGYLFSGEAEGGYTDFDELDREYGVGSVYELLEDEQVRGENAELYAELITSTSPESFDDLMEERVTYRKLKVESDGDYYELDEYLEEI